jgi:hypothetical protein
MRNNPSRHPFTPKPKGMNASEIKYKLHKMFPAPDWLAIEELFLPDFDRYVDFWAMRVSTPSNWNKTWSARVDYLKIHAIEIKVTIADFKSEMKQPNKRMPAIAFSNYFSFATPRGLIDPSELPKGAGLIEFRGSKGKFIKQPQHTHVESPGWDTVAAIGRSMLKG